MFEDIEDLTHEVRWFKNATKKNFLSLLVSLFGKSKKGGEINEI